MISRSTGVWAGILAFVIAALALLSVQIFTVALRVLLPAFIIAAVVYLIVNHL